MDNQNRILNLANSSRRQLLGTIGATAGAAAGLSIFGAPARAAPRRGGVFRATMPQGSTTDVLDPTRYLATPQYLLGMALGNCLVELTGDKKPVPELAESWDISGDLKRWTFKIRKGVQFHNGKTLDSGDVVYSLRRHIGKDSTSVGKSLLGGVTDIVADGPDTVVITHETGTPDLHYVLATYVYVIVPKDFTDWPNFVGTGPYRLKTFNPGVRFEGVRNPNYWKPNSAWFDELHYVYINDPNAAINALLSGQVDAAQSVAARVADRLKSNSALKIVQNNGTICTQIDMDTRWQSFADPRVRNAIKYLIDRPKMVNFITSGFGLVGNDQPIPPTDPFFNAEIPQRAYDPDRAKFLLRQAGVSSLDLELHAADTFAGSVDSTAIFQQTASAAGVNVKIRREPVDGYWSNVWMKVPFMVATAGVRATPDLMFSLFFASNASWNETFWYNEKFDKLLVAGRSTADFAKRKEIYGEMQQIIHDDCGVAIFMFPAIIDIYSSKVGGTAPDASRPLMGCKVGERAWFES